MVKRGVQWGPEINEPLANVREIASYQGVTSGLQDVLHFLETKGNMKDANEITEVVTNVQSDRLNNCNI